MVPTPRPLRVALGSFGSLSVPVPLTNTHVPVAGKVTALPLSPVLVTGVHSCLSGPALAAG